MDIQDFEAWVARRDPQWFLKPVDDIFGLVSAYKAEESLTDWGFPKHLLSSDMQAAKQQAAKPQLNLF